MKTRTWMMAGLAAVLMTMAGAVASAAPAAPDSKRMERAKDYIADEQWARAIVELQAIAADSREANHDEALFWLAQSEHETGDDAAALQTLARLERQFPTSRWVRLGRSLRVEIAQSLKLEPWLWTVAAPPAPPVPPSPAAPGVSPVAPAPPGAVPYPAFARTPRPPALPAPPGAAAQPVPPPSPVAMPAGPVPAAPPTAPTPPARSRPGARPAPPAPPPPPAAFALMPGGDFFRVTPFPADTDLRIEALTGLLEGHSDRVIPLLREIALDGSNPDDAKRAVFVLARSNRPEARTIVVDVARSGVEPVRLAAIREMGYFDGAAVTAQLMQVYQAASTPRIKRQIVSSLGERGDNMSLLRIARAESDPAVRNNAIVTLGKLPEARPQLRLLYDHARPESRMAILSALLTSQDEDELIRIAKAEKEPVLRQRARVQLRMLATPKAIKFLEDNP